MNRCYPCVSPIALYLLILTLISSTAMAQVIDARDDFFGVAVIEPLVVDAPGILDNDLIDEESAESMGATAELVTPPAHGTLTLTPDGAFTYSPSETFTGLDAFVYAVVTGSASAQATVFLTACNGGPDVFVCWEEDAFLAMASDLGYFISHETFEGPVWDTVRTPTTAMSVTSQDVRWTSNYTGDPVANSITTSGTGDPLDPYFIYDANHGYATGTAFACDVDLPDTTCLYHDGFTGEVVNGGQPLVGVSAVIDGDWSSRVSILLNDQNSYPSVFVYYQQFVGIIDTRPGGFTKFSFEEQSGKIGQRSLIWGHDFTYLTSAPVAASAPEPTTKVFFAGAGPNPASSGTTWRFSLPATTNIQLAVYDTRGRLVRRLVSGSFGGGDHAVNWDSRDGSGRRVAAGTYFGKLKVGGGPDSSDLVRKLVVLH